MAFKCDILPEVAPCAHYTAQFNKLYLQKPLAAATSHLISLCTGSLYEAGLALLGFPRFLTSRQKADLTRESTPRRSRRGLSHQGNCLLCFCDVHWKSVHIQKLMSKETPVRHQPLLILMERTLKSCERQLITHVKRANPLIINRVFVSSLF